MFENLIEGVDYFVRFWDFPNTAADMFVVPNDDGTYTIVFNSRFTREQLMQDVDHEFVHILCNHFQDDRDVAELEQEADRGVAPVGGKPVPIYPVFAPCVAKIPRYLTARGLLLGELESAKEFWVFGDSDPDALRRVVLQMMADNAPLVVR